MIRKTESIEPRTAREVVADSCLPTHEAERLLSVATGLSLPRLRIIESLDGPALARFDELEARRCAGEPLQYLEGSVTFGPVELHVDRRVLVPRPETEQLYELAAALMEGRRRAVIVDLCTGSGNLAAALARHFPDADVYAVDSSAEAAELAAENFRSLDVEVAVATGSLFDPLPDELRERVDLIVANPPYVAESEFDALPVDVREHEPRGALVAGPTGLEVIDRIARQTSSWLAPGGWIVCEIGATQGARARALFPSNLDAEVERDLSGRDRFVVARRRAR